MNSGRTPFDPWLKRTEWWLNPATWTSPGLPEERIVADLAEAIGDQYVGKEVQLDVRGAPVTLVLEQVSTDTDTDMPGDAPSDAVAAPPAATARATSAPPATGPAPTAWSVATPAAMAANAVRTVLGQTGPKPRPTVGRLRVDARNIAIGGRLVDHLTAWADRATVELGIQPHLATGGIEIEARLTRENALAWAADALEGWTAALREDGSLFLRQPGRRVALIARPSFSGDEVRITLERARLGRFEIRVPKRFVQERVFTVPSPAPSLSIVDISDDGEIVIHLRHGGIREPVRLDQIRRAIVNGLSRLTIG